MTGRHSGRINASTAMAVLVAIAGTLGFAVLMWVAAAVPPHAFDTQMLLAFRQAGHPDMPIGPLWLQEAIRDLSSLGSVIVLLLVMAAVIFYLLLVRRLAAALFVFLVLAGGQVLCNALKLVVDRPRLDLVSHLSHVSTLSFPSSHAMMSAVTYLTLAAMAGSFLPGRMSRIYLLALALLVTLAVGTSRIYLGVHWPSDVLAGWCAGFAWTAICWLAARFWNWLP
ncbi:phosphatase PAP2 family protein [Mesorhizobium sp. A556]